MNCRLFSRVFTALALLAAAPTYAQNGYGQPGGYGPTGGGYGQPGGGYGPQGGIGPQGGGSGAQGRTQAQTLPPGVDKIYAMEGPNALLLFATQQGYETTMEIVKALDGELALTRTSITYARATPDYLTSLGVTVGQDGTLSAEDVQKLVDARSAGKFTGTDTLRITSREEFLNQGQIGNAPSALSVTEQTNVTTDGRIQITLLAPLHATVTLTPGQSSVIALRPNGTDLPISLLFLTSSVQPG
jgi:hypothetical protein